jgi:epsilon-lactone hydrolase
MPTFKSKMVNFMIRNNHRFRGKISKEVFDMNTSIDGFRERCEKGANRFAKVPADVSVEEVSIDGMKAEWLVPEKADRGKTILYVHGGGYVSGSCNDHRSIVASFAKRTGIAFLIYEYGLAPEHPFPAAIDDSVKAYQWLLSSGYLPENIVIAGESAGGGLCLALLLALKERDIAKPVAAVAMSPWTDLTCSGESYHTKNRKSPAPLNSWHVFAKHYAGENPRNNPLISPLFGDLSLLPPLLIISGVDDELFDDGERFSIKAREAGVDVTFIAGEGQIHCYPLLDRMFKEATDAMDVMVAFIRKHLMTHVNAPVLKCE